MDRKKLVGIYCSATGFKQQKLRTAAQIVSKAAATMQCVNEVKKEGVMRLEFVYATCEVRQCNKKRSVIACLLHFGIPHKHLDHRREQHWGKNE
jgi:hypothetical protein